MFELIVFSVIAVLAVIMFLNPIKLKGFSVACAIVCFCAGTAYAQDVMPNEALPPEWIGAILMWVKTIPSVGPVIVQIISWVAVLGTVFTVLSAAIQSILVIPEIAARVSGATEFADKIKKFSEKILPWFKYFSSFNVQKK